ncbi:MAG: electron transport complex subunit RsxG [Rhodocyclaceae bacterium]|nr:electron transport complex subunit RsxG [Rhodocyclaceae bacterium]
MSTPAEKHAFRVSGETALTLVAFIVFFTALLAWAFLFTKPTIEQSARAEKMAILNQILPARLYDNDPLADTLTLPPEAALGITAPATVYRARLSGKPSALVVDVVAPDGYSGNIKMLAAFNAAGQVIGVRVVEHKETPGLGDYIDPRKDMNKDRPWINQFNQVPEDLSAQQWHVRKDGGDFDAYAGATVTPRAVVKAIYKAQQFVKTHRQALFAREGAAGRSSPQTETRAQ